MGQLPIYYNYKRTSRYIDMDERPLFPFGYGLSYSEFTYSNFSVEVASIEEIKQGGRIAVSFDVTNVSEKDGKAVPQLYINKRGGTITHRRKELKAFEKVALKAKETKRLTFFLGFDALNEWSTNKKYELLPCELTIMLGTSSEDIVWKQVLEVK